MDSVDDTTDPQEIRRRCKVCDQKKPLFAFYRNAMGRGGYEARCKVCRKAANPPKNYLPVSPTTMLRCTKCEQEKQASAFYKNRRSPTGYRPDCKACVAQHQQGHYKDNCEDILARNREYRLAHLTEEAVRSAKWRANHQPQILATRKVYYAKNRASILARNSVHVHRHRHARQRTQTIDSFSLDDIATRDAWVCQICFRKVNKRLKYPHPLSGSLDHVIPLSRGGYHTRQNVVLTHLRCNLVKNAHAVPQQQRLF